MTQPPDFASIEAYRARLGDVPFWQPYVHEILHRHALAATGQQIDAGHNPTSPTFLYGEVVVKLFGYLPAWERSERFERGALALVTTNPALAAPTLLAHGLLYEGSSAPWPYLISRRMRGVASWQAGLTPGQQHALALALGQQIGLLHALPISAEAGDDTTGSAAAGDAIAQGAATEADWAGVSIATAATESSLPPHLAAQAEAYVTRLGPSSAADRVFTHGDIVATHVYVEDGRLSGIIDWGDATIADRHVELIQIYRDLFRCDRDLFRVFLEAADWPRADDFPHRALAHALRRQAMGLAQHPTIDVFMPIARRYPLAEVATLEELAELLFARL
ncbi:MAG: phosphotransferase [Chloroflexi bacterium]|nr:phosphotransferase [Chloroflexota bacterium]